MRSSGGGRGTSEIDAHAPSFEGGGLAVDVLLGIVASLRDLGDSLDPLASLAKHRSAAGSADLAPVELFPTPPPPCSTRDVSRTDSSDGLERTTGLLLGLISLAASASAPDALARKAVAAKPIDTDPQMLPAAPPTARPRGLLR